MKIRDRVIGECSPVYIIAEMSANHGGSLERALEIVHAAKDAGADCLKIQTYDADSLTLNCRNEEYRIKGGLWNDDYFYDLYQQALTPYEWQKTIKNECGNVGIDFFSTPFDRGDVDFLEELGVQFYKIASMELVDIPLIEYIASKQKPIIMSVGMGNVEEITEALDACYRQGNHEIAILKCCSQYPAQYRDMNLAVIPDMIKRFQVPVGLSDHSFGSLAPVAAVSLGAKIIEKHICISRRMESPDSAFSMEASEFKQMVEDVRNTEILLGKATYNLTDQERTGLMYRRSLVASRDIAKGEMFSAANVKSVRPSIGLKPKYYDKLIGKKAMKGYKFGEGIREEEIVQNGEAR